MPNIKDNLKKLSVTWNWAIVAVAAVVLINFTGIISVDDKDRIGYSATIVSFLVFFTIVYNAFLSGQVLSYTYVTIFLGLLSSILWFLHGKTLDIKPSIASGIIYTIGYLVLIYIKMTYEKKTLA